MSEIGELKQRVDSAVGRLKTVREERRHYSEDLVRKLGALEEKFAARAIEVDYCRQKIADLERVNRELITMVDAMLGFLESDLGEPAEQGVFRASALAQELVEDWTPPPNQPRQEPAWSDEPHRPAHPAAFEAPHEVNGFEDVTPEELEIEALLDPEVTELPESVVASLAVARPSPLQNGYDAAHEIVDVTDFEDDMALLDEVAEAEDLTADIEIPDVDEVGPSAAEEDRESDIRALMARLERAAARARGDATDADEASAPDAAERAA